MPTDSAAISRQSLRWLFNQATSAAAWICLSVGLGIAGGLLLIVQAGCLARIIHQVAIDGITREHMVPLFIVLIGAVIARAALHWGREMAGFRAGALIREKVRMVVIEHITRLGPGYMADRASGALASTIIEQVEGLEGFFARYLPQMALAVSIPLAMLSFVFPISWAAGALLLGTAPLIPLFMMLIGMGAQSISQRYFTALSRLSAHFLDVLQGLATLKLFDRSRPEEKRVAETSAAYRIQTMRVLRVAFLSSAVLEFFTSVAIALVAVYLGMTFLGYYDFGTWGRPLTLSGGLFILLLAPDFYLPLRELGIHYHTRAEAMGAAAEIIKVLKTPLPPQNSCARRHIAAGALGLSIEELHLTYQKGQRRALAGVNLSIAPGEHIAVVGESGAGKTSLLNAILGFVTPARGKISVNDISLADLAADRRNDCFAWIGQDPVLFHGTIRENILMGRREAGEAEVRDAAEAAGVSAFTHRLPAGLETRVGEQGYGLSRGEAQRVALARAWLKNAPILLLDEPTAGLDRKNEKRVMSALQRLTKERTVLMMTHRLSGLRQADRIAVMEGGEIVACDTYDRLMANHGALHRLVNRGEGDIDASTP